MSSDEMISNFLENINDKRPIGFVYLITDGNYYKIGMTSKNISLRIKDMQTGNANKLQLVSFAKTKNKEACEWYIHHTFRRYRYRGEWFKFKDETQVKKVVSLLNKIERKLGFLETIKHAYISSKSKRSRKY